VRVKFNAESEPLKGWEDSVEKKKHEDGRELMEYNSDSEMAHRYNLLLVTKTHLVQMVENPYST